MGVANVVVVFRQQPRRSRLPLCPCRVDSFLNASSHLYKTHCKEPRNLRPALFHGHYFQISYFFWGLYGFRDHSRIQSDVGGYQINSRLGLRGAYYPKPPQKIIKIDEKKWEF